MSLQRWLGSSSSKQSLQHILYRRSRYPSTPRLLKRRCLTIGPVYLLLVAVEERLILRGRGNSGGDWIRISRLRLCLAKEHIEQLRGFPSIFGQSLRSI